MFKKKYLQLAFTCRNFDMLKKNKLIDLFMKNLATAQFPENYFFRFARYSDNEAIQALFSQVYDEFGFDVDYHSRDKELMDVTLSFSHPRSFFGILVHIPTNELVGTIAIKHLSYKTAEVARFYMAKNHRGRALSTCMIDAILSVSKKLGYDSLYLETHTSFKESMQTYLGSGFRFTKPLSTIDPLYTDSTMQLRLQGNKSSQKRHASPKRRISNNTENSNNERCGSNNNRKMVHHNQRRQLHSKRSKPLTKV